MYGFKTRRWTLYPVKWARTQRQIKHQFPVTLAAYPLLYDVTLTLNLSYDQLKYDSQFWHRFHRVYTFPTGLNFNAMTISSTTPALITSQALVNETALSRTIPAINGISAAIIYPPP